MASCLFLMSSETGCAYGFLIKCNVPLQPLSPTSLSSPPLQPPSPTSLSSPPLQAPSNLPLQRPSLQPPSPISSLCHVWHNEGWYN